MANPQSGKIASFASAGLSILAVLFAFLYHGNGLIGYVFLSAFFLTASMVIYFYPTKAEQLENRITELERKAHEASAVANEALMLAKEANQRAKDANSKAGLKSLSEALVRQP